VDERAVVELDLDTVVNELADDAPPGFGRTARS
jgi:hypothetical protein